MSYNWLYICKTITPSNFCGRKVVFTAFTEICQGYELPLSSMIKIKCYYSQRNSPGTERKDIISGNLCIMKANALTEKLSFPL